MKLRGKCRLVVILALWPSSIHLLAQQPAIVLPIEVPEIEIQADADNRVSFICRDTQWLNLPGEPHIPWQVITVLLPCDAVFDSVSVRLKNAVFEKIDAPSHVEPAPPLTTSARKDSDVFWPKGKRIIDGRDINIYDKDEVWPDADIKLVATGQLRTWKLAQVAFPLIKYNPVRKFLKKLASGELEVYFDRTAAQVGKKSARAKIPDRIGRKAVKKMAVNFDQQATTYSEATASDLMMPQELEGSPYLAEGATTTGYAIITTSEIQAASQELGNFVTHKQSKGLDVQVITEPDFGGGIGDDAAENIRAWLQGHYLTDNIKYVLLVGNPHPTQGEIPMKMLYPRNNDDDDEKESPSDFYYADLTGNWDLDGDGFYGEWEQDFGPGGVDRFWDVLVGRIPCYPELITDGNALYDSGPTRKGTNASGWEHYNGFMSGYTEPGREQRWSAQPFTIPDGNWCISHIDVDYFFNEGEFDLVNYIIWRRTGQERPEPGDELVQGSVSAPFAFDDPRIGDSDDYLHQIPVDFQLQGGNYYLTVYAERSDGQPGSYLAWMGNTESGIPLLDPNANPNPGVRAFFWRSERFPDPGFQVYNLPTSDWASLPGQDPNQLYTAAFTIYGEPVDTNDHAAQNSQSGNGQPLDVNSLDRVLRKIMTYENTPQSESEWRYNALLVMKPDEDNEELSINYHLGEELKDNIIRPKMGWSYYRIYEEDYGLEPPPEMTPCNMENVTQEWTDSAPGVVLWSTHGVSTSAVNVMDLAHAAMLNDDYPAFTFQASCLNAHPETANNLAYSLLKNGAVCTVASTRVAFVAHYQISFAGTTSAEGMAAAYLSNLITNESTSGEALYDLQSFLAPTDSMFWMNYTNYNIYGCPAVGLFTFEPDGMTVLPHQGITCQGDAGGPFDPNSVVYTLTNKSTQVIDYSVSKTKTWLNINGSDGPIQITLEPNEGTDITVSLSSNAESLYAGKYEDSVEFVNQTTGIGNINRRVLLRPGIIYGGATIDLAATGLVIDSLGNLIAAGCSNTGGNRRLSKIDPNGSTLWSYALDVWPAAVVIDTDNNIFIAGSLPHGTRDLDPTEGEDLFLQDDGEGFLTHMTGDGHYISTCQMPAAIEDLSICSDGGLVFTGHFKGTHDFNPTDGDDWHSSAVYYADDVFITKLGGDLTYEWTRTIGSNPDDFAAAVAADQDGNITLTGTFQGTVDFDPSDSTDQHSSHGQEDVFVTKLTQGGDYCWTRILGGVDRDWGRDIAVDYHGNVFVVGRFGYELQSSLSYIDFDPTEGVDFHVSRPGEDVFVTKLDSDGNYGWTRTITRAILARGGFYSSYTTIDVAAIALDNSGSPLILGSGSPFLIDFDPSQGTDMLFGDAFLTRLSPDGDYGYTAMLNGDWRFYVFDLILDSRGTIYIGGEFQGTADLDPTTEEDQYSVGDTYTGFVTRIGRGAVPYILADADHDGYVRPSDLNVLASHWLDEGCQDSRWCDWTDFDRSTNINFLDYAILAQYWLEHGTPNVSKVPF